MADTKQTGLCVGCKKKKKVSKRRMVLPTGHIATSQDLLCDECYNTLKKALNPANHEL